MGFDGYLTKPITKEELRGAVEALQALERYEQLRKELSSKQVKRNVLESEKPQSELEHSEPFQQLTREIEELERELRSLIESHADGPFEHYFDSSTPA